MQELMKAAYGIGRQISAFDAKSPQKKPPANHINLMIGSEAFCQ